MQKLLYSLKLLPSLLKLRVRIEVLDSQTLMFPEIGLYKNDLKR